MTLRHIAIKRHIKAERHFVVKCHVKTKRHIKAEHHFVVKCHVTTKRHIKTERHCKAEAFSDKVSNRITKSRHSIDVTCVIVVI